jgi:hypothetical protein
MGLLEQINNSKYIIYKSITKELLSEILDELNNYIVKKAPLLYVGELAFINMSCIGNDSEVSKKISKLFKQLPYYNYVIELYNIKYHHINVGYSIMTIDECNIKRRYFIQRKDDIETNIRNLYYGKNY